MLSVMQNMLIVFKKDFNALANMPRRLIERRQKFAAYFTIYRRKPDAMNDVTCDWST